MPHGLPRKLRYAFILQAVAATFAIVIGVYAAGSIVGQVVAEKRLHAEADNFWQGHARNPAQPLPRSLSVDSYFIPAGGIADNVPGNLRSLPLGVSELPGLSRRVLVEDHAPGRLYIVISFRLLDSVVRWTGLVSMLLALIAIYVVTWTTYRASKRLVVPVGWLAEQVARWDPRDPDTGAIAPDLIPAGGGSEIQLLGGALRELGTRMHDFVHRERDFTRDASHELRTPLTVIRVATDMMLHDPETTARAQRSLGRMQRAGRDMEAVIDAFLILARDSAQPPLTEDFDVREVVDDEIDKVRELLASKSVELRVVVEASPRLHASPRVLSVMLGQLLDNACVFTEQGWIEVRIEDQRIVVSDTGIGMVAEILQRVHDPFYRADPFNAAGKGMGLSIVRRLGERFGWPVTLESTPGEGTVATIGYGDSRIA